MTASTRYTTTLIRAGILAAVIGAVSTASLRAQTPLPPTLNGEDQSKKTKIVLDKDSRLVADEYVDLLKQLQDVIKDYNGYLRDSQAEAIKKYREALAQVGDRLAAGSYDNDSHRLTADLDDQLRELNDLETEIRESTEIYPMRTYRLVKSLRREIAGINDLVQNDLADRLKEKQDFGRAISEYVRAVLANLNFHVETSADGKSIIIVQNDNGTPIPLAIGGSSSHSGKGTGHSRATVVATVPPVFSDDSESNESHMAIPATPAMPDIPPRRHAPRAGAEDGIQKELFDSLEVTSPSGTIRLDNRMGQVTVSGTSDNQITAHLAISYEADSRDQEKEFAGNLQLKLDRHGEDYVISAVVPNSDGSDVRISGSELTIEVPSHNPLVIINNLGSVSVSDMQADVNITGSYSQVEASDIAGQLTISSNTGEVSVSGVKGQMNLKNSYAPITVSDSKGDMTVQNSYGPVSLSACRGDLNLKNSGPVDIEDHVGDLTIDNSFGEVEIRNLKGSLTATNRFQPITVSDVEGAVKVEAANSQIELTNISGGVTASNKFGLISVEEMGGPLKLTNQNGSISVVLGDNFRGNSSITTSFGNISLEVPETANLFLNARTQFGSINSFKPLTMSESGMTKSGTLRLGRGKDSLLLVTANASISIDSK